MRPLAGFSLIQVLWVLLCAFAMLLLPQSSTAQSSTQALPDTRGTLDYASTGRLTLQIQDTTGAPFFEGAAVTLLTSQIETKLSTTSDQSGLARFTALPAGQYVVEIAAPGYRTVQEQVRISGTREDQNIVVSLVPTVTGAKVKVGSVSASPKAVKESEKAIHALQLNRLNEAQQHLSRALALDPTFADGNYLMGLLLLRQKETSKAAAYLQKALTLSPDHTAFLLALGEAQYLDHDYSRATTSLEKFLQEQPNSPQASAAQKYVDAMRKLRLPSTAGDAGTTAETSDTSSSGSHAVSSAAATVDSDPPPLPDITPITEANWAPPDVDAEKLDLDPTATCQLDQILHSVGSRAKELVQNVDRFTATEEIEHSNVSPMGLQTSRETRKFDYLVEIRKVGTSDLDVHEYRNGPFATEDFPGHIATIGLPTLALIFHPYLQARYEFQCEGRGSWQGHAAWVVHFHQRADHASTMLTYHVGNRFVAVGLKGRAWIDVDTSQILAMESDLMRSAPEIRLLRDHQLIEYGPVRFHNKPLQLWLPKSADWYCSISGRRFHRRHTFSQFLLFSTDDKQKISAPIEPVTSQLPK
ncbi:MAG: carboxypeptidase regulatory-like domain-containing protein [Candidatus Acidiferrum sp.]